MGQGHYIIHLYFFITMLMIDTSIDIDLSQWLPKDVAEHAAKQREDHHHVPVPKHGDEELSSMWHTGFSEMHELVMDSINLSGHGEAAPPKSQRENKKHELSVFYVTRLYHIVSFVMILLVIELKRWKCFLTGQALQSLFITISMFIFSYVIYVVKMNFGTWNYEMNYIRAWLLIEVMYFFNWIISGIVFLILSKLVKFHPIVSDEAETENDEDVWNDRQTQDFVVHLKTEFFHFCYMCSLFTQTCIIGFSEYYFIGIFGPRDFTPTTRIIAVITLHRFWTLFSQLVAFHKGEHVRSN